MDYFSTKQISIYFVHEQKKCELYELKDMIKFNKVHEVEITEFEYTQEDFKKTVNDLMISDLVKIVYEYVVDKQTLYLFFDKTENILDTYYLLNNIVYNFYTFTENSHQYGIKKYICPEFCKELLKGTIETNCNCTQITHTSIQIKYTASGYVPYFYYIPEMSLMYEIFKHIVEYYYTKPLRSMLIKN